MNYGENSRVHRFVRNAPFPGHHLARPVERIVVGHDRGPSPYAFRLTGNSSLVGEEFQQMINVMYKPAELLRHRAIVGQTLGRADAIRSRLHELREGLHAGAWLARNQVTLARLPGTLYANLRQRAEKNNGSYARSGSSPKTKRQRYSVVVGIKMTHPVG